LAEFTTQPGWDGPYYGLDYGFAQDPSAAVRCWIHAGCLWVDYEAGKVGMEIDQTPAFLIGNIPGIAAHVVRADSARPESTSYLKRHGLPNTVSVDKWSGSVEDGVAHLRSYAEIVIHPRCRETIRETRLWSYKKDRLTGDVLPVLIDANNHYMDALRYALAPLIRRREANSVGISVQGL
jgi:phage terminase large subunit